MKNNNSYKEIVEKGYDNIGIDYEKNYSSNPNTLKSLKILDMFCNGKKALDLGIGTGIPTVSFLLENGYDVTGIDLSNEMLSVAKTNVPEATLIKEDMCDLSFEEESFDCAVALFSFLHLNEEDFKKALLESKRVLNEEGHLLFSVNEGDFGGISHLLNRKMYFNSFIESDLDKTLNSCGFRVVLKFFGYFEIEDEVEKQMYYLVKKEKK